MRAQPFFPQFENLKVKTFGGSQLKGNAREARPISTNRPLHLVLRSSLASGERSFLRKCRVTRIRDLIRRAAAAHDVRVYRYANAGNHLHLVILPRSRVAFNRFIREITGKIARLTLGVERGRPQSLKFWDARPFTRIVEWGRDFRRVSDYLGQNILEALGFIPYRLRAKSRSRSRGPGPPPVAA